MALLIPRSGEAFVTMAFGGEVQTKVRAFNPETDAKVGAKVVVRSFGRPRFGVVIKVNKTRAVVRVPRNSYNTLIERAFAFDDILIPENQRDRLYPAL